MGTDPVMGCSKRKYAKDISFYFSRMIRHHLVPVLALLHLLPCRKLPQLQEARRAASGQESRGHPHVTPVSSCPPNIPSIPPFYISYVLCVYFVKTLLDQKTVHPLKECTCACARQMGCGRHQSWALSAVSIDDMGGGPSV